MSARVAQLVERLSEKQEVTGSSPVSGTITQPWSTRAISSVGRAPRLHRGCRGFESLIAHQQTLLVPKQIAQHGRLAQLVEHLAYTEGVGGSSPSSPTTTPARFAKISKCAIITHVCGSGSVGRATPCQGVGRGFEPRLPLHNQNGLGRNN
jgi:hypothetical protein